MKNLIEVLPALIGSENINSVNSRDLYSSLELGKGQYSRWINKNLVENDFFHEDKDYIRVRQNVEGNPVESFIVSLDVAKHLSMMSKTSKAHDFRNYFIQVEKEARKVVSSQSSQIQILQEMINQVAITEQRVTKLESNLRIENWQQKKLEQVKNLKVYEIAEKHDLKNDAAMIKKLHSRVWKSLKNKFSIPRYNELPACEFANGVNHIQKLTFKDLF